MYATLNDGDLSHAWTYGACCVTVGLIVHGVWLIARLVQSVGPQTGTTRERRDG